MGIHVQGPGAPPHLGFACCEHGTAQMQSLFDEPGLIASLNDLHATVAIPILDFSSQRAGVVRRLNQGGVPVVAWIMLPEKQGYYLNADNEPEAETRVNDFEKWTRENDLRWSAVGLDIEPNSGLLAKLKEHPWRLITTLLSEAVNGNRIASARKAYSILIGKIQSLGYPVQIYQMPYIPAERRVHSTLPDRLLGTVDVSGNENYLMLYTSDARPVGVGMIWSLGPDAQAITIGSTDGDSAAGSASGPLDWNEFSRDLIVASHFTSQIGVYDLEGCVRQGFLPRLKAFDWSQSVTIPAESVRRAALAGFMARSVLWIASRLLYLIAAGFLLVGWLTWRRRIRRRRS